MLAKIATVSEDPAARSRAQLNTAYLFELEGDENKAAQQFSALSMQSVNPVAVRAEAACAAGRIYLKQGKKEAARKILKPAVALRPAPGQESAALWVRRAAELELTIN